MGSTSSQPLRTELHFFNESDLLDRLTKGLQRRPQEVVFVVGAALSMPEKEGTPGVPGVDGVIGLIRSEFADDPPAIDAFENEIKSAAEKRYQAAFQFLQGRRGQPTANEIIRKAVLSARIGAASSSNNSEEYCRFLDSDTQHWAIRPATEYLGKLVVAYPERFGQYLLTTNFDPLLEVSIQRAGGNYARTALQNDGNLQQTEAPGCNVVHLHGYWHGTDTLHTARQLGQARPRLKSSLANLLRNKIIVVCGYGGWDDAFTDSLVDVVRDDGAFPQILWTFYGDNPTVPESLLRRLDPGIDRGTVTLYSGIDCHSFIPELFQKWQSSEPRELPQMTDRRSNPVKIDVNISSIVIGTEERKMPRILEGDEEDRPPLVEICVGRDDEIRQLLAAESRAVFLTGFGGQGKSTLAAKYFGQAHANSKYDVFVWRDCKEETDRFENQLTFAIEKLSGGKFAVEELARHSGKALVEILVQLLGSSRVLFVFDNIDVYVDIERRCLTGTPHLFVEALVSSESSSQALFTCRPEVSYASERSLSLRLQGLDLQSAYRLFTLRNARCDAEDIRDAHELTQGHAFWLDLLALQVAKQDAKVDLRTLLAEIRRGGGPLPEATLKSIWDTLKPREQIVLRAMAETVRAETEESLADYLSFHLTYNKVAKSLKALRTLNLVVVKNRPAASDVLELHPLVRHFIRSNFSHNDRVTFIQRIIVAYQRFIGTYKTQLEQLPSLGTLQYWTENAELDIEAERFDDAFKTLAEASKAFMSSPYLREYCRVARKLFEAVDWCKRYSEFAGFEVVFDAHVEALTSLGEFSEADALLNTYETTVPNRDARYIDYCEMRSHTAWFREDFPTALDWGYRGEELKKSSGVDTRKDVGHQLALAQRDSGRPEIAIQYFLRGRKLTDVTNVNELEKSRGGAYYGNIGRCLQFMGSIEQALICYQKSAALVEDSREKRVINQAYIRQWIAEALVARGSLKLARVFLRAAILKWDHVSPPRAKRAVQLCRPLDDQFGNSETVDSAELERICLDWIVGRTLDEQFR